MNILRMINLFGLVSCIAGLCVAAQLKRHVDPSRMRQASESDPSSVFGVGGPSVDVLSEKGRRLSGLAYILIAGGIGIPVMLNVILILARWRP